MPVPMDFRQRRIDTPEGYGEASSSVVHDPYLVPGSDAHRKATIAILEALIAMANEEIEASKESYTTTVGPLRSFHSSTRNDNPDVILMLISAFVLIGLVFVIGIFISLLR